MFGTGRNNAVIQRQRKINFRYLPAYTKVSFFICVNSLHAYFRGVFSVGVDELR